MQSRPSLAATRVPVPPSPSEADFAQHAADPAPDPAGAAPSTNGDDDALLEQIDQRCVEILYRNVPLTCAAIAVTSLGLGAVIAPLRGLPTYAMWLAGHALIGLWRLLDYLLWQRRAARASTDDWRRSLRRLYLGTLSSALLWAIFPVLFFRGTSLETQAAVVMTYAALVGGNIGLLSVARGLLLTYSVMLFVPISIYSIVAAQHPESVTLGLLGLVFVAFLVPISRGAQRTMLGALRLSEVNRRLVDASHHSQWRLQTLNCRLESAQQALTEANRTLENRVRQRTLALEREIRERGIVARRLETLAASDPMTGLANRAQLEKSLNELVPQAAATGSRLAVLFVDLDRFKEVNDAIGHLAGDHVLRAVSRRLRKHLQAPAVLSRWGGDEFVALAPALDSIDQAEGLAGALRALIAEPIPIQNEIVRIDACVGVALYPDDSDHAQGLLRAADIAVYAAKMSGRSTVRRYQESMHIAIRDRHELGQALREAIEHDCLELHYQPIVRVADGRTVGFEGLMRWQHPTRGWVTPSEFIPVAEQSGSISALGRWALLKGCSDAALWTGPDAPTVAINVSAAQLLSGDLLADVRDALRRSGLPPSRLELELTESFFVQDAERVIETLAAVRELGVRVAIDDFGTGYSTLSRLRHLPVDVIKIDRSFIAEAQTDAATFVDAIQRIAGSLGLTVTAEGVETVAQRDILRRFGVDYMQGYLIARPMTFEQTLAWAREADRTAGLTQTGCALDTIVR